MFIGRTDAEAEVPMLWHVMQRANSLEKTLMLGKIEGRWRQGQQRMRWLDDVTNLIDMSLLKHEFAQALGVDHRQGSLVCCSPWGGKESDMIERLN